MHGSRWRRRSNRGGNDVIELREAFVEIRLPYSGDLGLIWRLAVAAENFLDDVHASRDLPEGGEAHRIQTGVFAEADEKLSGTGIRTGSGERQKTGVITLSDGIVLDGCFFPSGVNRGIWAQAELHDEARDHAEEGRVGEEAVLDEIVEAVGAEGRPRASDLDDEIAGGGLKR